MKRNKTGWLTVDYDDSNQETFKGLKLSIMDFATSEEIEVLHFNTGDPIVDWFNYHKFLYGGEAYEKGLFTIGGSSNVDHWFIDGDKYIEKHLKVLDNGDRVEFMTQDEIDNLSLDELNATYKSVITQDIKSFQELKDYVKAKTDNNS